MRQDQEQNKDEDRSHVRDAWCDLEMQAHCLNVTGENQSVKMGCIALNWFWRVGGLQEGAVPAEAGKALLGRPCCSQPEA